MLHQTELNLSNKPKRLHSAWAMYDWANSAYNLVITSTIFPAYYTAVAVNEAGGDTISFFGLQLKNSALFDYALAAAYLIIAFLSPVLSSVADYRGNKKTFMKFFCYLGALACCGLYIFDRQHLEAGVILFVVAAIGYCGSLVFYNAYLPEIAADNERDMVSAKGYAYGYVGSVILQLICFLFVLKPELFGIADSSFAPRLSFLLVGIWWLAWAQIPFFKLPESKHVKPLPGHGLLYSGFIELKKVWQQLKHLSVLRKYLAAFFFYSMGVQTVMLAATIFGSKELKMDTGALIATILIIQLVAIAGAYLMARLAGLWGNIKVLFFTVLVWICVCVAAYYTTKPVEFYFIAAVVGLIMGGIQSLSRSTYARLMPETKDTASFFSFYDVTEKVAIVIGMFSFGFIDQLFSMRHSILILMVFFAIGAIILLVLLFNRKPDQERVS